MDTVTYPDDHVAHFIEEHFIPARVRTKDNPQLMKEYSVIWTPNVVITDDNGKVHHRIEGFLPPEDFLARLSLGVGKFHLDRDEFDNAAERFQEIADRHHGTDAGAEALYWLGVAHFKKSHDKSELQSSWRQLADEYPNSDWTKRSKIPE
jgi:hypothetical protein